jgi:hypothetical protein
MLRSEILQRYLHTGDAQSGIQTDSRHQRVCLSSFVLKTSTAKQLTFCDGLTLQDAQPQRPSV